MNRELEQKKIAVIIPVYNVEPFLPKLIESLNNQTEKRFNVYFIDDCSEDGSCKYIEDNIQENWKLIKNHERKGAAISRNLGINISTEDYVQCLDADDYIEGTFFEEIYHIIDSEQPDVVMLERDFFENDLQIDSFENHRHIFPTGSFSVTDFSYCVLARAKLASVDICVSRNFIDEYNIRFQNLTSSNDVYYTMMSMLLAKSIVHTKSYKPIYHTRIHFSSSRISSNRNPMNAYLALLEVKKELKKLHKERELYGIFGKYSLMSLQDQLNKCKDENCKKEVFEFLKSEGLFNLGIKSAPYDLYMEESYKKQFDVIMNNDFDDISWNYSLYMIGLCNENEKKIVDFMSALEQDNKISGFWGLGGFSKGFLDIIKKSGYSFDYYFDKNLESGKAFDISITDFDAAANRLDRVVVSTTAHFNEIYSLIKKKNPLVEVICMEDILYD